MNKTSVTVTQLNEYVRQSLSEDSMLSDVIVSGELSGVKNHSSGHIYFTLKDAGAVIRCAFFKPQNLSLNFKLNEGMKVLARGRVTIYSRDGQYQLNLTSIQRDGIGELYQRFEMLKAKLDEQGLFDKAHKRSIPFFAKKIGVVTSPTGAVIRDIINVATRRFYGISIVLAPVQVQGEDAPRSICAGIECLNKINDIDVIPLTNFWQPNENEFTIFGHDTTGYGYIPIHYATAKVNKWHELMKCTGNFYEDLMREINISKDAYSKEWEKYWFADWDLFTKRCNEDASRFTFIERGLVHIAKDVTAKSRIDRYDYERTINQPEIIDIHCHNDNVTRKENIEMIKQCLLKYFGEVPAWFNEYVEYYKLEYQAL